MTNCAIRRRLGAAIAACFMLLAWSPAPGQEVTQAQVSLITIGPGATYWERFGHNALLVENQPSGIQRIYHYGLFDFQEKDFMLNFIRGRMRYLMGASDRPQAQLQASVAADRSVWIQPLELKPSQVRRLIEHLQWNLKPDNVHYRYDYFFANCSTKIRDAIDLAVDGALKRQFETQAAEHSLRWHVNRLTAGQPWLYASTELGLGPLVDAPIARWDEFFLPMELMRGLTKTNLATSPRPLHQSQSLVEPDAPPQLLPWLALAGMILGLILAFSGRRWRWPLIVWFGLLGFIGLGLAALWALTEHTAAHRNANLLLLSPLALWPALLLATRPPYRRGMITAVLAAVLLPALAAWSMPLVPQGQHNLSIIAVFFPANLGACWALLGWRKH